MMRIASLSACLFTVSIIPVALAMRTSTSSTLATCNAESVPELTCESSVTDYSDAGLRFVMIFRDLCGISGRGGDAKCPDLCTLGQSLVDDTDPDLEFHSIPKSFKDLKENVAGYKQKGMFPPNPEWEYWSAFVQAESSQHAVALYSGLRRRDGWFEIKYVQANADSRYSTRGAVSWGLNMLLHRLKLRGGETAYLDDASSPVDNNHPEMGTLGARVYAGMQKEKRPYKYAWTGKPGGQFVYELRNESYGVQYAEGQPC